jgi:hypothetical protein
MNVLRNQAAEKAARVERATAVRDSMKEKAMAFFATNYGLHSIEEINAKFPRDAAGTAEVYADIEKEIGFDKATVELADAQAEQKQFGESLLPRGVENRDALLRRRDLLERLPASQQENALDVLAAVSTLDGTDPVGVLAYQVHKSLDPKKDADAFEAALQFEAERMRQAEEAARQAVLSTSDDEVRAGLRAIGGDPEDIEASGVVAVPAGVPTTFVPTHKRTNTREDLAVMEQELEARFGKK